MMKKPNRRTAVKAMAAMSSSSLLIPSSSLANTFRSGKQIKLGVIADLHGGLAVDASSRLDAFVAAMEKANCDALIQLGDFAYPNKDHQAFADTFNSAHDRTLHVIGNHEFDHGLTRNDCYRAWGIKNSYYRTDVGGVRILVLDGNDEGSPTYAGGYPSYVGKQQLEWLQRELESSLKPILILSHQPLAGVGAVDNAEDIQKLLARFKTKILLCLNGHTHVDSLVQIDGVSYLHVNSASYYWVGGKTRMAYYTDPLFASVSVDPESATIEVAPVVSAWKGKTPSQIGYFEKKGAPSQSIVTPQIRPHHISRTELNVMTWNIWGRLNQDPRYNVDKKTARQRTIEIVEQSGADIVAMIETYGSAADIAAALGFHHHTASAEANLCIFSRYPLSDVQLLKGLNPFSFIAATVELPGGQKVRVYDIWLTSGGRHIVKIKDESLSDEDFARGDDNRFEHLKQLLHHDVFQRDVKSSDSVPLIVAGDFNCVSHLDHNEVTRQRKLNHSRVLSIKVSRAMQKLKFVDTYRTANPDITSKTLGHTWTTVGKEYVFESGKGFVPTEKHPRPEYHDPYARIDYIYSLGKLANPMTSNVVLHHPSQKDRSFPEFPSDHAAVITKIKIGE